MNYLKSKVSNGNSVLELTAKIQQVELFKQDKSTFIRENKYEQIQNLF